MRMKTLRVLVGLLVVSSAAAWPCENPVERWVVVVGLSADGARYAVRITTRLHEGEDGLAREKSLCGYPDTPELASPDAVELATCTVGGACTAAMPVYPLPQVGQQPNGAPMVDASRCGSEAQARKNLEKAKAVFARAGIELTRGAQALPVTPSKLNIPAVTELPSGTLAPWGVSEAVSLSLDCPSDDLGPRLLATAGATAPVTALQFEYVSKCLELESAALTPVALIGVTKTLMFETPVTVAAREKPLPIAPWDLPLARLASRLLNQRGLDAHRSRDYPLAAQQFGLAFKADPTFGHAAFNQACALARQGDVAGVVTALEQALAVDRKTFVARAKKDPDLASARKSPQVAALLR